MLKLFTLFHFFVFTFQVAHECVILISWVYYSKQERKSKALFTVGSHTCEEAVPFQIA
jgi:hypothetical protein